MVGTRIDTTSNVRLTVSSFRYLSPQYPVLLRELTPSRVSPTHL